VSVVSAVVLGGTTLPVEAGKIYWLEPPDLADWRSRVFRTELDGSYRQRMLRVDGGAKAMQLDPINDHLYWSISGAGIVRGGVVGCETLIPLSNPPYGIELDLPGGRVYWVTNYPGELARADLDGSNVEVLVSGLSHSRGLALDLDHGKVYWTENSRIGRADLDGSNVETVIDVGAFDVAVDPQVGQIYWIDVLQVHRADLDGSNVEDLVQLPPSSGFGPWGVALDLVAGKLYWAAANLDNNNFPEIGWANLDGSEPETLLETGHRPIYSLTIVSEGVGVSRPACWGEDVPALGHGGVTLLILILLGGSGLMLRRPSVTRYHSSPQRRARLRK
jgi:hypothetical protein